MNEINTNWQDHEWDCCVLGNGALSLWAAHYLWSIQKSVLWITSDEPFSAERAMLQRSWLWGASLEQARLVSESLKGFGGISEEAMEVVYYDAKTHKRFKLFNSAKPDWGKHEKAFFESFGKFENLIDLFSLHLRIHAFHDSKATGMMSSVELFSEPRFVRVQNWPLEEIKTENGKISSVFLAGKKKNPEIKAKHFFLSDFDEYLPLLIKNEQDSALLSAKYKGKTFLSGFGLKLWHKPLEGIPSGLAIIPLLANPSEKGGNSHVVGRFHNTDKGLESYWIGFLTEEELEDNNEILKKIKHAKRAIDRAIPGFVDSIEREAVTFEPRMVHAVQTQTSKTTNESLGAFLLTDLDGLGSAIQSFAQIKTHFQENLNEEVAHLRTTEQNP